jgi:hypothetical protein
MANVLEEYNTEEQRSVVRVLWPKDSMQKIFIRNVSCLRWEVFFILRKAVHNWVEKRGKRVADDEDAETEVRKWLR